MKSSRSDSSSGNFFGICVVCFRFSDWLEASEVRLSYMLLLGRTFASRAAAFNTDCSECIWTKPAPAVTIVNTVHIKCMNYGSYSVDSQCTTFCSKLTKMIKTALWQPSYVFVEFEFNTDENCQTGYLVSTVECLNRLSWWNHSLSKKDKLGLLSS